MSTDQNLLRSIAVLIPAWQPEPVLLRQAIQMRDAGFGLVLVVDDGSSGAGRAVLADLVERGFPVIRHAVNMGKGRALKTGFNALLTGYPELQGVVTADADGQHRTADIVRTAQTLVACGASGQPRTVLGSRAFDTAVPLRSRFGNALTRWIFGLVAGVRLRDTQTGLRGFPMAVLPELLTLAGEGYDFEMNVLTHLCRDGQRPVEVMIETVYVAANRSSHFNPIRDSMRIYFVLVRFYASSLAAAALDFLLFSVVFAATGHLAAAMAVGRLSSVVNFWVNRRFVFHNRGSVRLTLLRYYGLAAVLALLSYSVLWLLTTRAHWNVYLAKLCVDSPLSVVSFAVQRIFIFRGRAEEYRRTA